VVSLFDVFLLLKAWATGLGFPILVLCFSFLEEFFTDLDFEFFLCLADKARAFLLRVLQDTEVTTPQCFVEAQIRVFPCLADKTRAFLLRVLQDTEVTTPQCLVEAQIRVFQCLVD
jgi:hypothetical protein